jgi:hypothetical protein
VAVVAELAVDAPVGVPLVAGVAELDPDEDWVEELVEDDLLLACEPFVLVRGSTYC